MMMQENEELPAELVGLYEVSFISQTLEDLLAEKMLEDNDYDSDGNNRELSNNTSVISKVNVLYSIDLYNELSNDFISSYQARINVNTNHPRAPNLLLDAQLQQDPDYIAVCVPCMTIAKWHNAPTLAIIPEAITNVLIFHWQWLSPVYLNCSLGCAENANQFTHYHHLTGSFGLTKNICALQLYSGTLGAILNNSSNNNWFYHSLIDAMIG
ncbi:46390_t:CDS:2 [Gigaspora margarita]|uniref:46390_t:CDS:1 n=1 Tax=Gigaspora margarita TaxID=4874 RepID=A0ABN7VB64_GIGMA|nr:46390_t:CDS:2 [Gigaspora margarita]